MEVKTSSGESSLPTGSQAKSPKALLQQLKGSIPTFASFSSNAKPRRREPHSTADDERRRHKGRARLEFEGA